MTNGSKRLKDATVKTMRTILSCMFKGPLTDPCERSCSLFREILGALSVSLKMLTQMCFFIKCRSALLHVDYNFKPKLEIAMHSFCEILPFSENYKFFNILKFPKLKIWSFCLHVDWCQWSNFCQTWLQWRKTTISYWDK